MMTLLWRGKIKTNLGKIFFGKENWSKNDFGWGGGGFLLYIFFLENRFDWGGLNVEKN